jgi:hypothetical protein
MPNAIRQSDKARPEQDRAVIALNARSEAIIEIVFMVPPYWAVTGIEGQTHKAKIFTADCGTLLIDCHPATRKLAGDSLKPALLTLWLGLTISRADCQAR